jgi:hypothetical protein
MVAIVPSSDMGIASTTFTVLENEPRNIQQTSAVSRTAMISSNCTSCTDSSMYLVESKMTVACMPSGRVFCTRASSSRMPSATATALAPRCLRMPMPWTGIPSVRERRRSSSKPSSTRATSCR